MLTQSELKELLHYDPETGVFTWLVRNGSGVEAGDVAGTLTLRGYWSIRYRRRSYRAHRLAFLYMTGSFPTLDVDHINGARGDNRWCNLREVTSRQNARNRVNSCAKSGHLGIYRHYNRPTWQLNVLGHTASFSDRKLGGTEAALAHAIEFAQLLRTTLGVHPSYGRPA